LSSKKNGRDEILTIRLEPELKEQLEIMAKAEERPLSQFVRRVLKEHLRAQGLIEPKGKSKAAAG
jgi:predicted HicB family RNase H-like nuclease